MRSKAAQERAERETLLVVEDDRLVCQLLRDAFTHAGYQVVVGYSGEEGLELFRERRPSAVVLDLMLPDLGGIEVLRQLRRLTPAARVIVLTGSVDAHLENEARRLGVADFLRKGEGLDVILGSVRRVLGGAPLLSPVASPAGVAHVLVVDDNMAVRQLLADFLSAEGYRVSAVASGEEALARIAESPPHVVLLDLALPGISGLEVLRWITRKARRVGVIVVSGTGDAALVEQASQLGSFDYVSKPIDLKQLALSLRAKLYLIEAEQLPFWQRWLGKSAPEGAPSLVPEPRPVEDPQEGSCDKTP